METAPFDLELAKQGHPLVTRNGTKIDQFIYLTGKYVTEPILCIIDNGAIRFYNDGNYLETETNYRDLLLDKSQPWRPEPQEGDIVLVRNYDTNQWTERIFLYKLKNGKVLTVAETYKKDYKENKSFECLVWNQMKPIPIENHLEFKLTLNGEEIDPSEISEETWNNLRKKNVK
jgi:hypothetical protein